MYPDSPGISLYRMPCAQPGPDPRRSGPHTPILGVGLHPLPLLLRRGDSREPGRGPPAGDRAPPRGVDVKPLPAAGPGTGPGPPEGAWEASWGSREPRTGSGPFQGPGFQDPRSRRPGRGGFYINPSRRGPAPPGARGPGGSETGPEWAQDPNSPKTGKIRQNPPKVGIPGDTPQNPKNPGTGPRREGLM